METEGINPDIISTLPQNITENILTLMPIRYALRTSVLSKKWRYSWRSMPQLVFREDMIKLPLGRFSPENRYKKHKLVNAIFHVLLLHNGPKILEFNCSVHEMYSELDQIISHLSTRNNVKELIFIIKDGYYVLPVSLFSVQGLERIHLQNCGFQPRLTSNGFSRLRSMAFMNVVLSAQMLQRFLSKCPLLEHISLGDYVDGFDFAQGYTFTFVEFLQYVPLIRTLDITKKYMEYLSAGGMPHVLPTSLVHLKQLHLDLSFMDQNEISSALCMIRSAPLLEKVVFRTYDNVKLPIKQTPTNFLDPEDYSDLKLDHLETLEIEKFSNLPVEMEFVKLIMAKVHVLKIVRIKLDANVTVVKEVKMLRDLVRLPFPRASPSAKLIFERPKA